MMTWLEVKATLDQGKTTALVYNGGTEQRGPQNVNGGHTLTGRVTVDSIALKLGNAIAAPVLGGGNCVERTFDRDTEYRHRTR